MCLDQITTFARRRAAHVKPPRPSGRGLRGAHRSIIHLINDVLLALIVLELLWTGNRFLKKQKFLLEPFFAIGIIAGVRRILLIEDQTSLVEHVETEKLYDMSVNAIVALILMITYYISIKAQKLQKRINII